MTAKQIFRNTQSFCMAKLALGGITVLLSIIAFAIFLGIGLLFDGTGILLTFVLWLVAVAIIRFAVMHYAGYLVKAGHVAVIVESVKTGVIPSNQVNYGKSLVQQRFVTSNVYFVVDNLVTGAVKQIQNGLERVGNTLDFIPGIGVVTNVAKLFVNISLGYIDECCLGWTFYNMEQGAYKSAADGVVIYAQNWKELLKGAAKTMLKVIVSVCAIALAAFLLLGILFKVLHWPSFIAFALACMITWVIKFAFIDSYIMCDMMVTYMKVAPATEITFDLYGKLSNLSSSFRNLKAKAAEENMQPVNAN